MKHIIGPSAIATAMFVASMGCASKGAAPDAPKRGKDACAKLEAETRARIDALASGLRTDLVWDALAPLGRCAGDPSAAGRWALELGDDFMIESTHDEDYETGELSETYYRITANAYAVYFTREGKRVASDIELPDLDQIITETGGEYWPTWPFAPRQPGVDTIDWTGRGVPQLVVSNERRAVVLHWTGVVIEPYAPTKVLPEVTGIHDFDSDGRYDLNDANAFEFERPGPEDESWPLVLLGRALPDGTFTTDDAVTRGYYRARCADLGKSPWTTGRDEEAGLRNIACGLLYGVSLASLRASLEAEFAAAGDDDEGLAMRADDVYAWMKRPVPVKLGRDDGRAAVRVSSASAASFEPAFKAYTFGADQAIDGDLGTSWQPKKGGANPWLELRFDKPTAVSALEIGNGFQREDDLGDLFPMNRRATAITVAAGGKTFKLTLDGNLRGYQLLVLPEAVTTEAVRITVTATAEGTRWKNVAISEVRVLQ